MRIAIVHNDYAAYSGEEAVVDGNAALLEARGHEVVFFRRSSAALSERRGGAALAFFTGIANPTCAREFGRFLEEHRPDIVHIHNLYPLISPSILPVCRRLGVPVVMTVHNFRLICPWGLFLSPRGVCERCYGGEQWCILLNCAGGRFKSLGYALRNAWARGWGLYRRNVDLYLSLNRFQKGKLVQAAYPEERIRVVPNMVASDPASGADGPTAPGEYVGFVGRISPEKGIGVLCEAARQLPDIPFRLAGRPDPMPDLASTKPDNLHLLGYLSGEALDAVPRKSRLMVLPSVWYEGFPMVLAEAMLHGRPVVCSRIGGLPEIVDDGETGLLFEPGNAEDLAAKIRYLWERPELCRRMGQAGREKALREYSADRYYERLMAGYREAIALRSGRG